MAEELDQSLPPIVSQESEHQQSPFDDIYRGGVYFEVDKNGKETKRHRWDGMGKNMEAYWEGMHREIIIGTGRPNSEQERQRLLGLRADYDRAQNIAEKMLMRNQLSREELNFLNLH